MRHTTKLQFSDDLGWEPVGYFIFQSCFAYKINLLSNHLPAPSKLHLVLFDCNDHETFWSWTDWQARFLEILNYLCSQIHFIGNLMWPGFHFLYQHNRKDSVVSSTRHIVNIECKICFKPVTTPQVTASTSFLPLWLLTCCNRSRFDDIDPLLGQRSPPSPNCWKLRAYWSHSLSVTINSLPISLNWTAFGPPHDSSRQPSTEREESSLLSMPSPPDITSPPATLFFHPFTRSV